MATQPLRSVLTHHHDDGDDDDHSALSSVGLWQAGILGLEYPETGGWGGWGGAWRPPEGD